MKTIRLIIGILLLLFCNETKASSFMSSSQDSISKKDKLFDEYKKMNYCSRISYLDSVFHYGWNNKIFHYPELITKIYMDIETITGHTANTDHGYLGILHKDLKKFEQDILTWRKIVGCCK